MTQVVIAGWMDYPAHRDQVLVACESLNDQTLAERGCLGYAFSADAGNPDRIRVFEWWTDQDALDKHLASEHVADFRAAVAGFVRTGRHLNRFRISDVETF